MSETLTEKRRVDGNVERKNQIIQATIWVYDVMDKYKECGTRDTEPAVVFQEQIRKTFNQGIPFKSLSMQQWHLYSDEKYSHRAAVELNKATRALIGLIRRAPISLSPWIKEYFNL